MHMRNQVKIFSELAN